MRFRLPFDALIADFVFASRRLRRNKLISATAIVSVAVPIGACLAAFQVIDALLLRPLPIASPDRLYALSREEFPKDAQATIRDTWEFPLVEAMRASVRNQAEIIAISDAERAELTFHSDQEMERAHVQYVSGNLFEAFRLHAAAGRLLSIRDDEQPGGHPVAVLSHDYWSRRFGQDRRIVGRTFRMTSNLTGTRIYEIVGVAEAPFTGTEPGKVVDVFLPAMMHWGISYPEWSLFRSFAHLRPGISVLPVCERLQAVLKAVNESRASRLEQHLEIKPAGAGVSGMQKRHGSSLAGLGALIVLVLLIACANVANLMIAQAAGRTYEMALRVSIGASRWRLGRIILVEAAVVGLLSSCLGWCIANQAAPFVLARVNPPDNPARLSLANDWRVLAFAFVLSLGVILLFGLAPALRASAARPLDALKGDGRRLRARGMHSLIAVQSSFCFVVLFVAGLLVTTVDRLHGQPNGFSPQGLVNIEIVNPANEPAALWDQVAARVRSLPGIQSVAYADWPLLDGYSFKANGISINGGPASDVPAWFMNISPGWLSTMKIPLLAGRDFRPEDLSPGAAIVNQTFARQFFEGKDPVGRWFAGTSGWMRGQRFQIVGLARDARYRHLREPVLPVAYTPFRRNDNQGTMQGGTIVVRTRANPQALASVLRSEIPRTRPEFRVSNLRTQQELIDSQTVRERLLAMLARFFGGVALLLAGVGLYGVVEYAVQQQRRELGIRIALGARPRRLVLRVMAPVAAMVVAGAATGLGAGLAFARWMEPLLYEVRPTELEMLLIPSVAVAAVTILAAFPAALHAVRIKPAALLRAE